MNEIHTHHITSIRKMPLSLLLVLMPPPPPPPLRRRQNTNNVNRHKQTTIYYTLHTILLLNVLMWFEVLNQM